MVDSVGQHQHDITERKQMEDKLQFLSHITEQVADSVITTDLNYKITWINQAFQKLYGYSQEEILGRIPDFLNAEPNSKEIQNELYETVSSGKVWRGEALNRKKDGSTFPCEFMVFPLLDEQGNTLAYASHQRDITRRKKTEKTLRLTQFSVDNSTDAVYWMGPDARFVYVNNAAVEALGYSEEELLTMTVHDIGPEFPAEVWPAHWAELKEKKSFVIQTIHQRKDESTFPVEITVNFIQFGDREVNCAIARDITERRKAEEVLKSREEQFRTLVENIPGASYRCACDETWTMEYISDEIENISGYPATDFLENSVRSYSSIIDPEDRKISDAIALEAIANKEKFTVEYRITTSDGSIRWIHERGQGIFDEEGKIVHLDGVILDITKHKKAEEALKKSEHTYRTLVETNPYGIQEINTYGIITYTNPAYQKMLGYTEQELLGKSILDLLGPESKRGKLRDYLSILVKEQPQPTTYYQKNRTKDNRIIDMMIDWNYSRDNEGRVVGFRSVITDITERKKAEQKVLENQAQLKSLASQLSLTEERERRRIATELHDQIGQSLVFSKIKLDELHQSATSSELTKSLDEICNNIGQIIQDTRSLTFDLSSPILNEIGLEAAISEWLDVKIQAKHGIETEFVDDGQQKSLDDDIRALLFRNVRELLVNVIKHAKAHKVKVSIRRVNEHIRIDVEDDGKGFDSVKVASRVTEETKFGLFSIRERLEHLGGSFEIDSEPGRGSKFTMTVPIKQM